VTLVLRYAARSDVGLVRSNNEDSVYAGARLLALADGMGGHAAGEVASQLVIAALAHLDDDEPGGDLLAKLDAAIRSGNSAIAAQVEMEPDLEGMGTTLTAILFAGNRLGLAHIGDSRGYLLRDGELTQITKDDTFVQTLVDEGRITREEAHSHPQRSLIMRALTGHEVEPTLTMREVRTGDRYLLCSDGLSDPVSDETILDALQIPDVTDSADRLIELALRGGGPDNVTCIVADVVDDTSGDDRPVVGGAVLDPSEVIAATEDSPASRAAKIGRVETPVVLHRTDRRIKRRVLLTCIAALAVIAAAVGGYAWTQSQYFVGRDGSRVALFRGINADFGPLSLYSVVDNSDLAVQDLTPAARTQVNNGITARSKDDGRQILQRLSSEMLPVCQTPTSPSPSITPSARSSSPAPRTSVRSTARSRPTSSPTKAAPARSTPARTTAHPSATPSATPPSALTPSPSPTDCRTGP
jgi:serine/threonine protein phosphatase PrpC